MAEGGGGGGAASEAIGAAAGAGSLLPVIFGRGQNGRVARGFGPGTPGYDPGAGYFGNARGEAQKYAATMNTAAQAADERGPNLANFAQANGSYGQADDDRARGLLARGGQADVANAMRSRALGLVPSIAQQQADRQMGQAVAAQGAQQASARGAAGLALAGQAAAGNIAGAQSAISNQAQINAANERMQAEGAAAQAFNQLRSGDEASRGASINAALGQADAAKFQADAAQRARDANDVRAISHQKMGLEARLGELNARTNNQATIANSYNTANTANQQTGNQNAQSKGVLQTILEFPKMLSDERAKMPLLLSGMSPASAAAAPSFDVLTNGGSGMDPMASLKKHSDFATQFVGNPTAPTMVSDERTKRPLLGRGGINPGDHRPPPAEDRRASFDPKHGWTFPAKATAPANDSEGDREPDDIDRQVAERRDQDARERTDPAVGLERISRDRSMLRRGGAQNDTDEDGRAPGTADFERTEPKGDPGPGKRPWWTQIGEVGKQMTEAQFGRGHMVSDARAKTGAFEEGVAYADALHAGVPQKPPAYYQTDQPKPYTPRRDPRTSAPGDRAFAGVRTHDGGAEEDDANAGGRIIENFARTHGVSIAEAHKTLTSKAAEAKRSYDESHAPRGASAFAGASTSAVADANRKMAGEAYAYKPGMSPDQAPGEPNFGPMAQNLEKNPITATAVKTDPATGLKVVDKEKALKVTMAGVADLQRQNDEMRAVLAKGGKR